ncbi:MFS Git1p-related glycerophosphoinositol and glycerophosphocholine permease [Collybia nuda]|uniref:MFS Git1p-related glycerophosphoinositol and glycerophosphocholine permease n=1 Tax=Collybia nuda TaxID=64659 RepID=A0A9P6CKI1_9AGAR|nr:MFS Git1p-related glycerophosphoinositol and glycerophosphocholine permease [Collybia nuda]
MNPPAITMSTPLKTRIQKVSLIFACGTALFSDGYANGVIGSVNTLLTRVYGKEALSHHNYSTVVNSVGFAGFVVGMVLFGYLSDKLGRKFGMMAASAIILVFSGLAAASSGAHGSVGGLLSMLSAMRFFLGIGLGAEYPCGSVSASEQSEEPGINKGAWHRWLALSTNTMIDFGFVIAAFVPLVLFWIFGPNHLHAVWRLSLGLGIIPALGVFLWRLNMDEPVRYKKDSMKYTRIPYVLVLRRYWKSLAAISFVWFLYDMIVYVFGIYSSTIVNNVTGGSTDLTIVFGWNVVINLFYMPGTILGAFVIDYLGPKWTLIVGLVLQAIIGFFMSGFYLRLTDNIAAFAVVYGIFLSFGEFGPGNCTFILASKSCPTAVRGQFFGVAAATGKLGAFIGTWIFPPIIKAFGGPDSLRGNTGPFWIGSALALLSALITFLFIQPLTPDGMAREDSEFREYLEVNGYDTNQMGLVGVPESEVGEESKSRMSSEEAMVA